MSEQLLWKILLIAFAYILAYIYFRRLPILRLAPFAAATLLSALILLGDINVDLGREDHLIYKAGEAVARVEGVTVDDTQVRFDQINADPITAPFLDLLGEAARGLRFRTFILQRCGGGSRLDTPPQLPYVYENLTCDIITP